MNNAIVLISFYFFACPPSILMSKSGKSKHIQYLDLAKPVSDLNELKVKGENSGLSDLILVALSHKIQREQLKIVQDSNCIFLPRVCIAPPSTLIDFWQW